MKRITVFIVLFFVARIALFSLDFYHLNEDQGLSSRRCFSICQDKKGFIWISTKLNIDRYDGKQVVHYYLQSPGFESPDNIGFNYVRLSPDSLVWAFTQSGQLYRFDENSDSFQFVYSIRDYYQSYNTIINDIFFESPDHILIATSGGVLRFHVQKKEAKNCALMDNKDVYHIMRREGLYYFSTKTGLYIAQLSGDRQQKVVRHILKDRFINRVFYDPKYRLFWVGTFSDGLYVFPRNDYAALHPVKSTISKPVRAIIPYDEQLLAVGVDGEGIVFMNRQTALPEERIWKMEDKRHSPAGSSIWDLLIDRQGLLWVATYHYGVSHTDHSFLPFLNLRHEAGTTHSLSENTINAVLEDREGDLWFGTNNGLSLLYRKTGQWKHFFQGNDTANKNVILTLCEDKTGKIWAGGYAFGLAEIDKRTGAYRRYLKEEAGSLTGINNVYAVFKDEYSDELWIGGIHGRISCYHTQTKQTRFYKEESLRCFNSYDDSTIVLGLYKGLFLLDKQSGETTPTKINHTVNHILRDGDRAYWVGTVARGLYYYDMKNDSLRHYTTENGLSSNHIYSIQKDEKGCLWIGTENGLNKFSPENGTIEYFYKQDGLVSNLFMPNASFRCFSNELLFGTADGAVLFHPDKIRKRDTGATYPLTLNGFSLFGEQVKAKDKASPLSSPINATESLVLPYNKNYFSIDFTLPRYQLSDKVEYSCFLEGYDLNRTWLPDRHSISYSKIQPGEYTFSVKAYVNNRLQEERRLLISIRPPWWNTTWARIAYCLVFLLIGYYIIRYYSERNKKRQTEEKMEFFINTAHDILTPLSLIEAPLKDISLVSSLNDNVKYLLSLALNNVQRLNHFVYQLIDFQKISLNGESLLLSRHKVYDFFLKKANAYKTVASQKFISLDLHIQDHEREVLFDKDKVNKMLDNLLSNAIKYTPFGGKIELTVSFHKDNWSFLVKDSGIGIPAKKQHLIFKHIFREDNEINAQNVGSGTGLKMVQTLVRIHQGKISFTSKNNEGTSFVLTFPYQYDKRAIRVDNNSAPEDAFIESKKTENIRLLIVQSEQEMATYLCQAFASEYTMEAYDTAGEAFTHIGRFNPNLAIVDTRLSDMDGFSFCRKVRDNPETAHIPVLLITNNPYKDIAGKVFASGAVDCIEKPFEPEILRLKVNRIIGLVESSKNKALADIKKSNLHAINNDRDQEFMDNLIQLIEQNIDNPELNIAMMCRELAMSRTLLYNRITQLTGNSPNEFIRTIRLKTAASLLISGRYSIAEVSLMVGIDNPKYFSRIFKEYYEVSPKNYLQTSSKQEPK